MLQRLSLSVCVALTLPFMAQAKSSSPLEIRQVQTDSTDVFAVLSSLQQAKQDLSNREYSKARQGFESVLMHDPNLTDARTGLRKVLIATGDIKAARPFITDMNSTDGVIIRVRSGEETSPIDLLKATLKKNPDPRLWTLLGQLQDSQKEHDLARQSYAMSSLAGARSGLAENNIGHSHWIAGEYEQALAAFTKATVQDPFDTQFDNNRRRALIQLGQTQDAIAGLDATRAGLFLTQAADKAAAENEIKLARFLYRKSLEITPRHNPKTAEKLALLK